MSSSGRHWDRVAPRYDAATAVLERRLLGRGRRWVCARATGQVLEVGVGTGANLPLYAPHVRLVATDPSGPMLEQARARLTDLDAELRAEVELQQADAQDLPFEDGAFDAVVATYVLCCVPDLDRALAEMVRVLRPGGDLLLADHVVSSAWPLRLAQRALEAVTVRTVDEHFTRRPLDRVSRLARTGREVEVVGTRRWAAGVMETVHARPRR